MTKVIIELILIKSVIGVEFTLEIKADKVLWTIELLKKGNIEPLISIKII